MSLLQTTACLSCPTHLIKKESSFVQGKEARLKMINYFCKAGDAMLPRLNNKHDVELVASQFSIEHQQFKHGLPMYAQKEEFLAKLQSAQCVVLRGGTGIGNDEEALLYLIHVMVLYGIVRYRNIFGYVSFVIPRQCRLEAFHRLLDCG